jgi:hypothetical protein
MERMFETDFMPARFRRSGWRCSSSMDLTIDIDLRSKTGSTGAIAPKLRAQMQAFT